MSYIRHQKGPEGLKTNLEVTNTIDVLNPVFRRACQMKENDLQDSAGMISYPQEVFRYGASNGKFPYGCGFKKEYGNDL